MKVSIITATYNSNTTISYCMDSILSQSYSNIEYIIIDGASKDDTLEIIKAHTANNIAVKVISEPDHGIYDALNKGIKIAQGDIIGFLHSDDILSSSSIIESIVNQFINSNADGVYGDLNYVEKLDTSKIVRKWRSQQFSLKLLKKGWMPAHPTLFLKKEIYKKYGGFNLNYKIAADYDFILRIFKEPNLKFVYLPKVITKMRVGGASNRSLKNILKKMKEDYVALRSNNVGGLLCLIRKNTSKVKQFF